MAWRVGIDIGGTFTDVALIDDASGQIGVARCPPRRAISRWGCWPRWRCRCSAIASRLPTWGCCRTRPRRHQRHPAGERGACGAHHHARLPQRAGAAALGALQPLRSVPGCAGTLIPRRRRLRVAERIGADGAIVALAEGEVDALIAALKAERVQAVAVSLLFGFLDPERGAARRAGCARRPGVPAYMSSRCCPRSRSSSAPAPPRCAPTWRPILASYLERLESAAPGEGPATALRDGLERRRAGGGGTVAMPAMAVKSGPAAGVVGGAIVARQTGRPNLLSFDIGRHHCQGQPDPRTAGTRRRRSTRSVAAPGGNRWITAPAIRSTCP